MRRLVVQRSAQQNLNGILRYITDQSYSRKVATTFVMRLRARCPHLASLPGTSGRSRPDLGKELRSFPHENYVIAFRYEPGVFRLLAIIEGHRDPHLSLIDPPDGTPPA